MILYRLACEAGHQFESWFRDSSAFDDQLAGGLVVCATCQSTNVAKTIMAPAVIGPRTSGPKESRHLESGPSESAPREAEPKAAMDLALVDDRSREMRAMLRSVRDKVLTEGQDVGTSFALEARRMHEGAAPVRQIYGQASLAEARDLIEDGIPVLPLPIVPDELN
jgi:hypothetical protein